MVLGPHVASGPPASELAAQEGHAATAGVLRFLEAHDGAAPEHAAANAARRAEFECPVCLEPEVGGGALALVPCGHQVCRGCWAQIADGRCLLCRAEDVHGVDGALFPGSARLRGRCCVQLTRSNERNAAVINTHTKRIN
jgi:hypothetical protein